MLLASTVSASWSTTEVTHGGLLQLRKSFLGAEPEAVPRPDASRTSRPLLGAGLGDGRHQQRLQACAGVVRPLLHMAGIDHERHPLQREGCLRHICGRHHLATVTAQSMHVHVCMMLLPSHQQ